MSPPLSPNAEFKGVSPPLIDSLNLLHNLPFVPVPVPMPMPDGLAFI